MVSSLWFRLLACLVCIVLEVVAVAPVGSVVRASNTQMSVVSSILSESEAFRPGQEMRASQSEATRKSDTTFTMATPVRSSGSPVAMGPAHVAPARDLAELSSTATRLAISQQKKTQQQRLRSVLQGSNTVPSTDSMQEKFAVQAPARAKKHARRPNEDAPSSSSQIGPTLNQRRAPMPTQTNLAPRSSSSFQSTDPLERVKRVHAFEPSQPGEPSRHIVAPAVVRALRNKLSLSQQRRQAQRKFAAPMVDQTTENHTNVPIAAGRGRFRVGMVTNQHKSDHRPHRFPPAPKVPSTSDVVRRETLIVVSLRNSPSQLTLYHIVTPYF
jgi:hypothetical protein